MFEVTFIIDIFIALNADVLHFMHINLPINVGNPFFLLIFLYHYPKTDSCSQKLFSYDPSREQRPMSLCLSRDDETLAGLEALPFRLMQQDCTAVKTLLLRLRRTLQEVMFHTDS